MIDDQYTDPDAISARYIAGFNEWLEVELLMLSAKELASAESGSSASSSTAGGGGDWSGAGGLQGEIPGMPTPEQPEIPIFN